jgi:hypothetical protein
MAFLMRKSAATVACCLATRRSMAVRNMYVPSPPSPSLRTYSSATDLAAVLQRELKEAEGQIVGIPPATPKGFTIIDREGLSLVFLKSASGDQVTISFSIPPRMEFDLPLEELKLDFTVLIEKPSKGVIEVRCSTCDVGFDIDQIAFFDDKDKKIAKDETADADYQRDLRYAGPHLDDLEVDLQDGIKNYLNDLGINTGLARYIQQYVKETKEPTEYKRWIAGLLKFMS